MSEKATEDEIAAIVRRLALPMDLVEDITEIFHDGDYLAFGAHVVRQMFHGVLDGRARSKLFAVDIKTLTEALTSLEFRRPTEDEAVLALERPAGRLRADLQRRIGGQWEDRGERQKADVLDAYLAGLRLRVPESLRAELEQAKARVDKEDDPEWAEYVKLHQKFEGERP